ncbi:MAG: DNA repair protein RadA [Chlorobi bacterium]|nr:DNA repair protein RadA [Chlorobiota bacterium]
MAKVKKTYYCTYCGARHAQWMGQCPVCKQWNTIEEEVVDVRTLRTEWQGGSLPEPLGFEEIPEGEGYRISTGNRELDTVLGGGMVPGSVILVGGEPGIGKSTLLLQTALDLPFKTLYVSGEESAPQIKMRARRLKENLSSRLKLLTETDVNKILKVAARENPEILIVDSIQTVHLPHIESAPGSLVQIRESAAELIRYAKNSGTIVFIVGHINKEGAIAGPKILEHMVDTVLYFEGDRYMHHRILRALKNRFGNTNEIGIFEMTREGLRPFDPSAGILQTSEPRLSGTAVGMVSEGIRAFAVETQALVSPAVYGTPQRSATGYDVKRLHMILAVLEKRLGMRFGAHDVFLNITGGMKVLDPGLDAAVAVALMSSYADVPIPVTYAFAGEVGLTGEIRPVSRPEKRIAEATKTGFTKIFLPPGPPLASPPRGIRVVRVENLEELKRRLEL